MEKKSLTIAVESRSDAGSNSSRKLRATGRVPAVLYGHGTPPEHLSLDGRAFEDVLHRGGRTGIVTLTGGTSANATVLVRDVQRNPVSHKIQHADLQRVSANESVHAKLPVVTVGVARGVKDSGGVMDVLSHELEIEGPANLLPEHLEVDVTELGIHEHVTAGEVRLPSGFKMITGAETLVISIEPSKTAQAVEDAAAGATLEQTEPVVVGEQPGESGEGSST